MLSEDSSAILEQNFSGITKELVSYELQNKDRNPNGKRYSDEAKHFYLPRTHEFARSIFSLPAQSSTSNLTNSIDCQRGLFKDVFVYLKEKPLLMKIKDCAF